MVVGVILIGIVVIDGGWIRRTCPSCSTFVPLETGLLDGFCLELEACGIGAMPLIDMGLEKGSLRSRVERASDALGLVEAGTAQVLRDAHEQLACLGDVEAGGQDRFERFVLLVAGNGREQFGVPDLDPAFIERELDGVGEVGERQTAIELGPGPAQSPRGFGTVTLARREVADGGIRLLSFRRVVPVVILGDRGFERFLIGHLADDDRHLRLGAIGFQGRPVAALAGDDGEAVALRTKQHGLEYAAQADRLDEILMLFAVEVAAGIIPLYDPGERQRGGIGWLQCVHGLSPHGMWLARRAGRRCARGGFELSMAKSRGPISVSSSRWQG
ncbi:hypothetical protein D9M73_125290 [compost metagenome]